MKNMFNHLKIKTKIKILAYSAISMLISFLVVTLIFSDYIQKNTDEMLDKELFLQDKALEIKHNVLHLHKIFSTAIYFENDDKLLSRELSNLNKVILTDIEDIKILLQQNERKELLKIVSELKNQYKLYFNTGIPIIFLQKPKEYKDSFIALDEISDKMFKPMDFLIEKSKERFNERIEKVNEQIQSSIKIFILVFAIGVGFFMVFGYLLKVTIIKSIQNLDNGIEAFFKFLSQKTDHIEPINIQYYDELGEIIEHLNNNIKEAEYLIESERKFKEQLEFEVEYKTIELERHSKILEQYKFAIDETTIVSKADLNGKITYVNDAFCKISKFSRDELIGQPHNIVRDPNVSSDTFKELWETIKSGKVWNGMLSNKAKDGSIYFVESTIIPVKNVNNEITEYFGIRTDISEIINLTNEIIETQKDIIATMGEIGESRSKETGNHVRRVAHYSKLFAELLGLSKEECELIYYASPMHDIGKIGITDEVLKKPGKLDKEEFEIMKEHSYLGYEMLKGSSRPIIQAAAIIAHEHHEKWNGRGYPRGLSGENIHVFGRITALADVFDALGSDRIYKKAWELEKIISLITEEKGKHFDPLLVDLFIENLDKFLEIRDTFTDQFHT